MKQTKIICDRCGIEFTDSDVVFLPSRKSLNHTEEKYVVYRMNPVLISWDRSVESLDLCPECQQKLKKWLDNKEENDDPDTV